MKLIRQEDKNVIGGIVYYLTHDESPDLPDKPEYKAIAFTLDNLPDLENVVKSIKADLIGMVGVGR